MKFLRGNDRRQIISAPCFPGVDFDLPKHWHRVNTGPIIPVIAGYDTSAPVVNSIVRSQANRQVVTQLPRITSSQLMVERYIPR